MGTVFVAYGESDRRTRVLEVALERAAVAGDELLIHHIRETTDESGENIRKEVARNVNQIAPDVSYQVRIDERGVFSDETNVSRQKRLVDAILEDSHDYAYVVMGNVQRDAFSELTLESMTEAVLETYEIPVLLVPV